jgi:hypothetical protein
MRTAVFRRKFAEARKTKRRAERRALMARRKD